MKIKVTVYEAADGWRWKAQAGNNEILASGEAYVRRHNCERAIKLLFTGAATVAVKVISNGATEKYTLP